MGLNAESLVVVGYEPDLVHNALRADLQERGFFEGQDAPVKSIALPIDFEKRNRRFFFLSHHDRQLVVLREIGDLAERDLARRLSRRLLGRVLWVALHESQNAWGMVSFVNGELEHSRLVPRHLFELGATREEYEGDATEEAFDAVAELGNIDPFVTYHQCANGEPVEGELSRGHTAFFAAHVKRPSSANEI